MDDKYDYILAKHENTGIVTLVDHLKDVVSVVKVVAIHENMDVHTAVLGAILHDIGKVSPQFQKTLKKTYIHQPGEVFRHEIASLFFLSLVEDLQERNHIIDMIIAHHKSMYHDVLNKGILDLDENYDSFEIHSAMFEEWSPVALGILSEFGIRIHNISLKEARDNYEYAIDYCYSRSYQLSRWKGLLMTADHLASAIELEDDWESSLKNMYIKPDLSYYNRQSDLYPLSLVDASDIRKHTIVKAPTGAGKTDFLLRRCRGRVFYTLPYQASINAMYQRIKSDLSGTDSTVYLLHSASDILMEDGNVIEQIFQHHPGASVKVLTPHQLASVVFGIKGYEAMALDLSGCDVILDEIHTYTQSIQAIVLKIIEILVELGCRIHVGTATMPTILYNKILEILGGSTCVYEVSLSETIQDTFNRHVINKINSIDEASTIIEQSVSEGKKILMVCNRIKSAQQLYEQLENKYPNIPKMLIHSHFKRDDRAILEKKLKDEFNVMTSACIVVSTQVVEVSLDISFDLMVTECAPIDSLIQRFGRINRKRTLDTIGHYKPIYVVAPQNEKMNALPYDLDVLKRSFACLPNHEVLQEKLLQGMLDEVYPDISFYNIDYAGIAFKDGQWQLQELCHHSKSALLDALDINSTVCVMDCDKQSYLDGNKKERARLEIPVSYKSIAYRKLQQLAKGLRPFVIPDVAYSREVGLMIDMATLQNFSSYEIL